MIMLNLLDLLNILSIIIKKELSDLLPIIAMLME